MPNKKRTPSSDCAWSVAAEGCLADKRGSFAGPGGGAAAADGGAVENGPERALILAAQAGDADAIGALYEAYRDRVWTILLYSLGDPLQAQDALQAVFFKVFRGLAGFRFQSGLFTWIYRIARNECLNLRRRRRAPHLPLEAILGSRDEIDPRPAAAGPETRLDRDLILKRAVMQLPLKMREVIVLKYVEGLSYGEISRALGCAPGTVASRLNRALAELGERLGPFRRLI